MGLFPFRLTRLFFLILCFFLVQSATARQGIDYLDAADMALLQGEFQEAVDNYMRYLNYGSKRERYKTWDDLGYAYLNLGRVDEALSYLNIAKDAMKNNFDNHLYLSAAFLQQGSFLESLKLLDEIERNVVFEGSTSWT